MITTLRFNHTPKEIEDLCAQEREKLLAALAGIAKIDPAKADFENTVMATETATTDFANRINSVLFLKQVSSDAQVRAAADRCENAVNELIVEIFAREDLYERFRASTVWAPKLDAYDRRLMDEYMASFKRNGLELSPEKRAVYIAKKKELVRLESEFSKNLGEWEDALEASASELDGVPAEYVLGLKKTADGKYRITLDYPHYYTFMENAKSADARRRLEYKFNNRGGEKNKQLLEQAIRLRAELAHLLGFSTHAAFVLDRRMAKSSAEVLTFLGRLAKKLRPKGERELAELLELKREDDPHATEINAWDYRYYSNQLKKRRYQVDSELIKKYFPLDVVLKGMFEIYQSLLGVQFVEETDAAVWHPSVKRYRVKQPRGEGEANTGAETIGFFFMDLFPREGTYGHAAAFTLISGYRNSDGAYQAPISAIVANFNPPNAGNPSLLEHSEVETLFHEFGHIMHQVLTRARHATFSGTSVKTDFVEAPSQMLENWVWNPQALAKLSGHYQDHSKPLPQEQIDKLVRAKLVGVGLQYLRQIAFGTIDLTYHTSDSVDSTDVYRKVMKEIMIVPIQDGTKPQASFGHLMGGYDAGYYGYLWSKVYAQDMFSRFEKEGLLNPVTGAAYRSWILEPGGEKEPADLIAGFLGRVPNEEAFLRSLGLEK